MYNFIFMYMNFLLCIFLTILIYIFVFFFTVRPFSMVDEYAFKQMINVIDPTFQIPVRNTIKKRLVDVERHVRAALNKELSEVWSYVPTLTTDHWTSNTNESYASFIIHFINRTWELKSISMGVIPFSRPHQQLGQQN